MSGTDTSSVTSGHGVESIAIARVMGDGCVADSTLSNAQRVFVC
ncbi:hypothetical protein PF003_g23999 [Phytophthora fragariae]|nr:hypothetical protein PF003_g23999 [Phytophthora fragariae]